ncbi:MAG: type II toxin-antitoxin system VapC family toxin [Vicinamibacterales bacterium]
MTLDSSALVAILFAEPGYLDLVDAILQADVVRVGAPTLVETGMVLAGRRGSPTGRELEGLVRELGITIVPFGEPEWQRALDASNRYGRGRHPAALNFGDCLAYATAATAGDTLLFVGGDFRKTDARPAL